MKYLCRYIITGVLSFVILFFSCVPPAHALGFLPDVNIDIDLVEFGDWLISARNKVDNWFTGIFDRDTCRGSSNYGGRHNFVQQRTTVNGKTGLYYICEYCGESAGKVGNESYKNYVDGLPLPGYSSDGFLIWSPKHNYTQNRAAGGGGSYCDHVSYGNTSYYGYIIEDGNNFSVHHNSSSPYGGIWTNNIYFCYLDTVPISGLYQRMELSAGVVHYVDSFGMTTTKSENWTSGSYSYNSGDSISDSIYILHPDLTSYKSSYASAYFIHGFFYAPVYKVTPFDSFDSSLYKTDTRPTIITGGNYGIIGDDGQLTIITVNDSIINEINNTYYNPATGKGDTITNWNYDYSDRSYNVTLESGDTVTVTYGDQNITIVEGDTVYNVYYVISDGCTDPGGDSTPSDTPPGTPPPSGGDTNEHDWRETDRTDPTCTLPGKIEYICDHCGQARVDVIPANGHAWKEKQHVPTQYDNDGNLIQEGYTIYECSVCGEQYKDMLGIGPPSSGTGISDDGGLTGWLNSLIKYLSSHLSGAVELILSAFRKIPQLFSGFTAFLSAMFPFIPDEIMTLFIFGMAAVVFIGIIRAIRR